jgi:erythromycin esterase-like protein
MPRAAVQPPLAAGGAAAYTDTREREARRRMLSPTDREALERLMQDPQLERLTREAASPSTDARQRGSERPANETGGVR